MRNEQQKSAKPYDQLIKVLGKQYVKDRVDSPFDFIRIANRASTPTSFITFGLTLPCR